MKSTWKPKYFDSFIKVSTVGCVLPYIPYFVQQLLRADKNRYLLANSDTDSLDYKLAILSAIHFMNFEHTRLFELKAQKRESNK